MRPDLGGFSADVAKRLTGVTYRQLVYWDKTGLVRPSIKQARGKGSRRVYSFEDLVELRVVARMLASGVTLPAVRKAIAFLKRHYADVTRPLARLTLVASGKSVLARMDDDRRMIDATANGQVVIAVAVGAIVADLGRSVVDLRAPRELPFRVRGRAYTAVLTPDLEAGGYTIEVPELPGVVTEADTLSEARRLVSDAARLWLDAREERAGHKRRAR